jgi:hypothetical protein
LAAGFPPSDDDSVASSLSPAGDAPAYSLTGTHAHSAQARTTGRACALPRA